jgi:hypothetical protein
MPEVQLRQLPPCARRSFVATTDSLPWGILIEVLIVKQSLLVPPKTVHVTTVPV